MNFWKKNYGKTSEKTNKNKTGDHFRIFLFLSRKRGTKEKEWGIESEPVCERGQEREGEKLWGEKRKGVRKRKKLISVEIREGACGNERGRMCVCVYKNKCACVREEEEEKESEGEKETMCLFERQRMMRGIDRDTGSECLWKQVKERECVYLSQERERRTHCLIIGSSLYEVLSW